MEVANDYMNEYFPWLENTFMDIPYWGWIGIPVVLAVAFIMGRISAGIVTALLPNLYRQIRQQEGKVELQRIKAPLTLLFSGLFFSLFAAMLPLQEGIADTIRGLSLLLTVGGFTWLGLRLVTEGASKLRGYFLAHRKPGAAAIIPLLDKILKAFLVVIAGLFLLQNFGFDVVAIITALGIGGVAIALASQKSVENVFGGAMLSLDQPVRVGDFCRWRDQVGTVEDIGLRSTKIRTLERTLVSVPNSDFSSIQLENFASRDKILLLTVIGLRYETTPDQMRYIVAEIQKLLLSHADVDNDPARARFISFGDYTLDIEIFSYIKTSDWGKFLEIREDIFLRVMEIVKDAGSDFAFPSQTLYMERGGGISQERQKQIDGKVQQLRQRHELDWPEIRPERKREIQDKIKRSAY